MGCTSSKSPNETKNSNELISRDSSKRRTNSVSPEKPILPECVIENIMQNTKFNREDILEWWSGFVEDCPSGRLDKKTFLEVYRHRYPHATSGKFCEHVFRTFNPDKKSRSIDFERFMCAIDVTLHGTPEEKLDWAFRVYDINGDERISRSEMLKILEAMFELLGKEKTGLNNPKKHVDEIFSSIDLNQDNYVSKEEFILGCQQDHYVRTILAPQCRQE